MVSLFLSPEQPFQSPIWCELPSPQPTHPRCSFHHPLRHVHHPLCHAAVFTKLPFFLYFFCFLITFPFFGRFIQVAAFCSIVHVQKYCWYQCSCKKQTGQMIINIFRQKSKYTTARRAIVSWLPHHCWFTTSYQSTPHKVTVQKSVATSA